MTPAEQMLIVFDDQFKKIGLNYAIHASSLLHIIREGFLPADSEIDLVCKGDDLTDEMMNKLKASYWKNMYPCKEKYGEMYFSPNAQLHDGNYVALSPVWNKKGYIYLNVTDSDCILWQDKKFYEWTKIKYIDREFNVPGKPEEYLEMWYGSDWKTPKSCHWRNNKNYKKWEELL